MTTDLADVVRRVAELKASGRIDDAIAELTAVLASDTGGAAAWELALIAAERREWTRAEALGRRAMRDGGDRHASGLGQILAKAGKPDEALAVLDAAQRHDATDVAPLVYRCALLADQQRYDEALQCLDRILSIVPDHPFAVMRERIEGQRTFLQSVRELYGQFAARHGLAPADASTSEPMSAPSARSHGGVSPEE